MKKYLFFVLLLALGVGILYYQKNARAGKSSVNWRPEQFTPATTSKLGDGDLELLSRMDAEFKKLSKSVIPSVVSITTTKRTNVRQFDPFDFLYGRGRGNGRTRQQVQNALGSGFIVSKEGHVVTNNHVIEGMDEIQVQLADGRTAPATLLGADPVTDLAILKINLPDLIPLPIGNSDEVEVGQIVFAIGNPYGLQESVSQGIISAKGRKASSDSLVEFFQTDAAVNQGNSGGPLVNIRGEVIGVNSQIFSESGGNQGIAFAIPSNTVKSTVESVVKRGRVLRGYLGVTMQEMNPALTQRLGTSGVMIEEVVPGSPAETAGIESGDIITKYNGNAITGPVALRNNVAGTPIDSSVEILLSRNGQEKKLIAKILEQPENYGALAAAPRQPRNRTYQTPPPANRNTNPNPNANVPAPKQALAGIEVDDAGDDQGVEITQIAEASPAAQKLQTGDLILEINRNQIHNLAEYRTLLSALDPNARQILLIQRGEKSSFVVIPPG